MPQLNDIIIDGTAKFKVVKNASSNDISNLQNQIDNHIAITGVKGNAESSYRTGNVNITKANIGLENVDNTADSEKSVAYAANAGTVNSLTVETAVPANAKFTDTTYNNMSASEANAGTATTARTITAKVLADYVASCVAALVNSAPTTLDTLKELSDALGNDPDFATTMVTALAGKLGKNEIAVNAEKVNNHTVDSDVPSGAKFTDTTYSNFVKSGSSAKAGLVPAPSTTAGTTHYLREDGTWQVPPNTTYSNATTSTAGLMSADDKTKLNSIASGAQANSVTGVKGNSENAYRTGNINITKANIGLGNVDNTADSVKSVSYADNAGTVNGLTVQTAVPANAKFTDTTYSNFVKSGSTAKAGLVPAPSTTAGTTKYLREDGNWVVPPNTTYDVATTSANGLMSKTDKATLDAIPNSYATQAEVNQLATTATNSVSAAVSAKNDAVTAKNQAQSIADGLVSIKDTAVDTSLMISGQAADSKTVGDKFNIIGATSATNNEYLCVWLDNEDHVLFGVKADGTFSFQKGIPKPIKDELDAIKARLDALEA